MQVSGESYSQIRPLADMLRLIESDASNGSFSTSLQGLLHETILANFHTLNEDSTTSLLDPAEFALRLATKEDAQNTLAAMERRAGDNSHLVGNNKDDENYADEMGRLSWALDKIPTSRPW
jgi:hypothetical protein